MRMYLYADEHYPVYGLIERECSKETPVEITEQEYADWLEVERRYVDWQQKLYELGNLGGKCG